jgi:Lecithin retinol acyltransferase
MQDNWGHSLARIRGHPVRRAGSDGWRQYQLRGRDLATGPCKSSQDAPIRRAAVRETLLLTMVTCNDRLLAYNEEPPLGSHLVSPRLWFAHHGIYIGGGRVIHYGGLGHRLLRGPVEEISLARFTHGRRAWVRSHEWPRFGCAEVIRRAQSRVGENCYRVLSNNCEHFCEWCLQGEHRSYQVESLRAMPNAAVRSFRLGLARVIAIPSLRSRDSMQRSPVRSRAT